MYSRTPQKLNEGEEICSCCNGFKRVNMRKGFMTCPKCQGKGKLDWIEKIVGVKPKPVFKVNWTSTFISIKEDEQTTNFMDTYTQMAAEQLAKEIDEELLRSFSEFPEHNKNQYLRRDNSDNRVISELMFYPTTESKNKDKKN